VLLLFFSDLHLDSPFLGHTSDEARAGRQIVRDTFAGICDLAVAVRADAVCCGGDLYEQSSIEADTGAILRAGFARLDPTPVLIAPGDHDPWGPDSLYAEGGWTSNVRIFTDPRLSAVRLTDEVTLWGAAHHSPPDGEGFLDDFWARGDGIHLALFHGTERSGFSGYGGCGEAVAPFSAHQIPQTGLHHALVGHIHDPHDADDFTYAGNPAPLAPGEAAKDAVVLVTVGPSGSVHRQRRTVAAALGHSPIHAPIDAPTFVGPTIALPVIGEPAREEADEDASPEPARVEPARVEPAPAALGQQAPDEDGGAIAGERTVRGQFVRDVRAATDLTEAQRERVLDLGLRALAGSTEWEVR
jgi:DNA repair exonuclease SbcCD nuclease subunit